ncbi:hypothetical protein LOAG_08435 [Loa loa]|uniref:Uncharacterized protein n=1 Tax=Loa loa TaxID=7209 RepID=A0A1S0TU84_LOALO|nr:hypothetical protein LOAG_08435 [Loa loa]EFO20056.2 hypothetical protein LOAG_08435 [Loa loa]
MKSCVKKKKKTLHRHQNEDVYWPFFTASMDKTVYLLGLLQLDQVRKPSGKYTTDKNID